MKKLTLLSAMILAVVTLTAQIIHVPADQPTIQLGIDAATEYDTVLVDEGTYYENINFNGKEITVASHFIVDADTSHILNTIIDGSPIKDRGLGSVVTFDSGEDTTSIICGFTITGGIGTVGPGRRVGGGILCDGAGAKILYNYIDNNSITTSGEAYGGGMTQGPPGTEKWIVIKNNKFRNNQINAGTLAYGGGLDIRGNAIISNNKILGNSCISQSSDAAAGGLLCNGLNYLRSVYIADNLITNNQVTSMGSEGFALGGGLGIVECFGLVRNNTISDNKVSSPANCIGSGVNIELTKLDLVFENNFVTYNSFITGDCYGGGFSILLGEATFLNNVIQNNQAHYGGGIFNENIEDGHLSVFINNTITGNSANDVGGGLYMSNSEAVVINTILWGNTSPLGASIYIEESNLEVRHSAVEGEEDWPGEGNMNIDPEFQEDGYHLHWPSLIVNEGKSPIKINDIWYDAPEYDIDGDERPFDGTYPDIGADEALWYYTSVEESVNSQNLHLSIIPNPFSFSTAIAFELVTESSVNVSVYNHLGEIVNVLLNESLPEGKYNLNWNAENHPSGIYYCVLKTDNEAQTTKMIKLK